MRYPPPEKNPLCRCQTLEQVLLCTQGHLLECHYPYTCTTAACNHLAHYMFTGEDVAAFESEARRAVLAGERAPYLLDESGNVVAPGPAVPQTNKFL